MTAPAGSGDAGLVLSAEEREVGRGRTGRLRGRRFDFYRCCEHCVEDAVHDLADDEHELPCDTCLRADSYDAGYAAGFTAARITRTPPPAGDAQGSQEARNGPVGAEDTRDGRGHGRDDEGGRGAGL